jgi:hypothetical protein
MSKKNRDAEQMVLKGTEEERILAQLSERVERAIVTIQELRRERDSLKKKLQLAEERIRGYEEETERLSTVKSDYERFQSERTEIRNRIESILAELETLDEKPAEGQE